MSGLELAQCPFCKFYWLKQTSSLDGRCSHTAYILDAGRDENLQPFAITLLLEMLNYAYLKSKRGWIGHAQVPLRDDGAAQPTGGQGGQGQMNCYWL